MINIQLYYVFVITKKFKLVSCSRSRNIMKENRIPIGKKKENIEKNVELKKSKLYLFINICCI